MSEIWDYIIAGGGTSGCVLANRLSRDPNCRVLLLEAGGKDQSPILRMPAGVISAVFSDRYNWKYPALPDHSRNSLEDRWSGGRVIGGSSSINGMLFMRGHASDYDRWAAMGCDGWDFQSLLPHFQSIENFEEGADEYRGGSGAVSVTFPATKPRIVDAFVEAAIECGHALNSDYNSGDSEGVGLAQASIKAGRRHSAAQAFLAPIHTRKNLEVRTLAQVDFITFNGNQACGVDYRWKGKRQTALCKREVILSAGAIGSPKILMHSGIGPANMLRTLGINVVHDAPNVGSNLMEHPGVYVTGRSNIATFNSAARKSRLPGVILDWLLRGRGPAACGTAMAQVLARSDKTISAPDLQLLLSLATFDINNSGTAASLSAEDGISIAACMLEPKGRGRVFITSNDPRQLPRVDHALLGESEDISRLSMSAKLALDIMAQLKSDGVLSDCTFPIASDAPDDEWRDYLKTAAFRADHPSGTCAMGSGSDTVLDPRLKVRGVHKLRVVDASIVPVIPNANTCATALVIAEKAAQDILCGR
ncbi:MAG: GMC family oxidoreductase N-terminal domain-containing protein [Pseudomonadota bacterium]